MIITYDYLVPGTTLFTVPTGVTTLDAYAWGAGGGGAGRVVAGGGGGGAGGAFAWQRFSVTAGATLRVVVATPGAAASANGVSGVFSWFGNTGSTGLVAMGGAGGITTSGGIGTTRGSIGLSIYAGGNGGNPGASWSGGGGGGAGRYGIGGNGASRIGGLGTSFGGGNGGRGVTTVGVGLGGTRAGGGGGGAFRTTATNRVGGIGGNGRISLAYTIPPIAALIDNFNDNSSDTFKWVVTQTTGSIGESNGQLVSSSTTSGAAVSYRAKDEYDLTSSSFFAEVVSAGNQSLASFTYWPLEIEKVGTEYAGWKIKGGTISAYQGGANLAGEIYNGNTHKWIRIRESGGTLWWDASSDGVEWRVLYGKAVPWGVSNVRYYAGELTATAEASASAAILDNFNVQQSANFPTTSVIDDFNRADAVSLGSNWTDAYNGHSIESNTAKGEAAADWNISYWNTQPTSADVECYITLSTIADGDKAGVIVRWDGANGYGITAHAIAGVHQINVYRTDNFVDTSLDIIFGFTFSAGDKIGMSMIGDKLKVYYKQAAGNWTWVGTYTDATYSAAGLLELVTYGTAVRIDDFGGTQDAIITTTKIRRMFIVS